MHLFLSLLHFYFKIKQLNLKNRTDAFTMGEKVDNLFSNVPARKLQEYDFCSMVLSVLFVDLYK